MIQRVCQKSVIADGIIPVGKRTRTSVEVGVSIRL